MTVGRRGWQPSPGPGPQDCGEDRAAVSDSPRSSPIHWRYVGRVSSGVGCRCHRHKGSPEEGGCSVKIHDSSHLAPSTDHRRHRHTIPTEANCVTPASGGCYNRRRRFAVRHQPVGCGGHTEIKRAHSVNTGCAPGTLWKLATSNQISRRVCRTT